MTVFRLSPSLSFPNPELAEPDGLLAVDGDLSPNRLLLAYENGIFPWFSDDDPILWWSPPQRMVLYPGSFKRNKSLDRVLRKGIFSVTIDTCFSEVIRACAQTPRNDQHGTWITEEIISAYEELHRLGFAHSFESWQGETLVGGLYGVSLGRAFFGESMFSTVSDASKVAFSALHDFAVRHEFHFIDCQMHTPHLASLGAIQIERSKYLNELHAALAYPDFTLVWNP